MDQEELRTAPAASRSQNVVYVLPHDLSRIRQFLAPALERAQRVRASASDDEADASAAGPSVLVLTADAEGAMAMARTSHRLMDQDGAAVLPLTAAARATRVIRSAQPLGVAGTPDVMVELVRASALKLEHVQTVILAWADDILSSGGAANLELLLGELPKETAHVLVAGELTPELEGLIERHLRRPRRMTDPPETAAEPLRSPIQYLTVAPNARVAALRRLLDELDPQRAVVIAPSEEGAADVRLALALLGYRGDEAAVQLSAGDVPPDTELVVLFELPDDAAQLSRVQEAAPAHVVALVAPRELSALRRLSGDNVAAYTFADARRAARHREEVIRTELRETLRGGVPTRELFTLEPLLSEFDGVELAAALLRLLEEARRERPAAATGARPAAEAPSAEWTRVFVNVGSKDGASVGDVLGAIAGESGVTRDRIGRIELRETHSLVDVAAEVADKVVGAVTGATLRGRRLVAREDRERPPATGRERPPATGRERPARGDRGARGERAGRGERVGRGERGPRGDRDARPQRGARGERSERAERGDRGARGPGRPRRDDALGGGARGPRGGSREERDASYGRTLRDEEREWAGRGDRVRNARRPRPGEPRGTREDEPPRRRSTERE